MATGYEVVSAELDEPGQLNAPSGKYVVSIFTDHPYLRDGYSFAAYGRFGPVLDGSDRITGVTYPFAGAGSFLYAVCIDA